ncbi:Spy/CpxP family protein refolding chaperone [Marinobacter sp. R17]|uniref:Spy/CpxP family protein refolding chaperone n=1 Tax=Marinobacter sp. R17 TaxID=2484250 RepID=UPI0016802D75|nr:periplasmic heavy metal sensor [Marinobacter sp. R17]
MTTAQQNLLRIIGLSAALTVSGLAAGHGFDNDDMPGRGYGGMMGMGSPGMMGGSGMMAGPGMMGGAGMMGGPGMMQDPDDMGGPGMMCGYGRGYRAWGNLSDDQRTALHKIQRDFQAHQWERMQSIRQERFNMMRAYTAEPVDKTAILDAQKRINALQLEMLEESLDTQAKVRSEIGQDQ